MFVRVGKPVFIRCGNGFPYKGLVPGDCVKAVKKLKHSPDAVVKGVEGFKHHLVLSRVVPSLN